MANKIVILDKIENPQQPGNINFRALFWRVVPATRYAFYAKPDTVDPHTGLTIPGFVSAYKDIDAPTLASIKAGQIDEVVESFTFLTGATLGQITAALLARFNQLQSEITNKKPYVYYGSYYDGAWHQQGVS